MDRTQLCGSCDVGSIPTGGTKDKKSETEVSDFLSLLYLTLFRVAIILDLYRPAVFAFIYFLFAPLSKAL